MNTFLPMKQCSRSARLLFALLGFTLLATGAPSFAAESVRAKKREVAAERPAPEQKREVAAEREMQQQERDLEAARRRLDEAAREVAELSMAMSQEAMPAIERVFGRRAALGINIGTGREDQRKDGVEILSLSPGGAAAEAGLKAGDVLIEIDGKSLQQDDQGTPRRKLLAAIRGVAPEEKVPVRYLRDGKAASATLVTRPMHQLFTEDFRGPRFDHFQASPHFIFGRAGNVFGSVELVAITPKLGAYFGAEKGLLVVRAPGDGNLQLEDGDVIVDIDGRAPINPSHAMRILASYQPGEKLKLNVLRMKKRIAFDVTLPENTWEQRLERTGFDAPADVVVPALPAMPDLPALPVIEPLPEDRA